MPDFYEPEARGACDVCLLGYDVSSTLDHCAEEGVCWEHCECEPDEQMEYRLADDPVLTSTWTDGYDYDDYD